MSLEGFNVMPVTLPNASASPRKPASRAGGDAGDARDAPFLPFNRKKRKGHRGTGKKLCWMGRDLKGWVLERCKRHQRHGAPRTRSLRCCYFHRAVTGSATQRMFRASGGLSLQKGLRGIVAPKSHRLLLRSHRVCATGR